MLVSRGFQWTITPRFPNNATTGFRGSLTPNATPVLSTPGLYTGQSWSQGIQIAASGITVRDCQIQALNADDFTVAFQTGNEVGTVIEHTTILGTGANANSGNSQAISTPSGSGDLIVQYCKFSFCGQPITVNQGNGRIVVRENFFTNLIGKAGSHLECLFHGGCPAANTGFSLVIDHNTFDVTLTPAQSCIFCQNVSPLPVHDVHVTNNWASGSNAGIPIDFDAAGGGGAYSRCSCDNNAIDHGTQGYLSVPQQDNSFTNGSVTATRNYEYTTNLALWDTQKTYAANDVVLGWEDENFPPGTRHTYRAKNTVTGPPSPTHDVEFLGSINWALQSTLSP